MDETHTISHYTGEKGHAYHAIKRGIPDAAAPWVSRLRAQKLAPLVKPQDRVLEFGVGSGWNLAALACRNRLGIDVAKELAPDLAKLGIEFATDLSDVASGSQDVIIAHHSLEHVVAPATVLARFREILAPGGRLLLYVPYERERRYRKFNPEEPNHHLYSWNPQTLGNLVSAAGFEVTASGLGEFGYDRIAAVWSHRLGAGETGFRILRRAAHLFRPMKETRVTAVKAASPPPAV